MAGGTPKILDDSPERRPAHWWSGLDALASRVVDVVDAVPAHVPLLLSGSWGAGKTTLLRAVSVRLDARRGGRTVWFDAWRHETEGAMLPALVRTVWQAMPAELRESDEAKAAWQRAFRAALALGLTAMPLAAGLAGGPLAQGMAGAASLRALQGVAGFAADDRAEEPPEDRVARLHRELSGLVELGWPPASTPEGPVILVDDLDRCSPAGAVALLDQIRALLVLQHAAEVRPLRARFVVAMDREVLARAVGRKFAGIGDYDGNRYLEKLFPIAFAVPVPDYRASAQLIRSYVEELELEDHAERTRADRWRDALMVALANSFFANPRLMKRCVNRFRLVTWFESRAGGGGALADDDDADRILAKWIAATERWHSLRTLMHEQGDDYWRRFGDALAGEGAPPGPEAAALMEQRGAQAWLRREMFGGARSQVAGYRAADLRLRRWGL